LHYFPTRYPDYGQETLRVTEELKQAPLFTGEKPSESPKPWWKNW
jgi:hypothetical protein